ncbi:MAG TPA: N-acetylmuramoyl-L-alanine amidase [Terriglobales bacterium]|nr:N-acetylmuramoyl-L-alanine amidase [Terriglobales bacterium]
MREILRTENWELRTGSCLAILLAAVIFLSAAAPDEDKHISVFSPVANYTLPVLERSGHEYVGLLELLEPLGRVTSHASGRQWTLRYNKVDAEFVAGRTRARIGGRDFDFTAPFVIENSRGLVPLSSLSGFLPRFLGTSVTYRESARRLFVGEVGIQVSFQLEATNPPRLNLNFSGPVNPTISTEPGKLRMVFKRDPVVSPGSASISFDDKIITQANYTEGNGEAELDVAASEPLLATFSNDRKTIVISAVEQSAAVSAGTTSQNPGQTPNSGAAAANPGADAFSGNNTGNNNASPNATVHRILAVVDPAHGGEERGAALTDKLAEKDVTLGFGRLLRHELEIRGFAVALLREGDTTSNLDQRASAANVAHAGVYISLHAVSQGTGAHVYTALLPVEGTSKGTFHAWNAAQAPALPISHLVATAIVAEFQKRQFPARDSSASLRPLNNVFMPAVAVELAPGAGGVGDLTSANYQQRAAAAIADAVFSVRDRFGVQLGAQLGAQSGVRP